jgi:hypothetical protein
MTFLNSKNSQVFAGSSSYDLMIGYSSSSSSLGAASASGSLVTLIFPGFGGAILDFLPPLVAASAAAFSASSLALSSN